MIVNSSLLSQIQDYADDDELKLKILWKTNTKKVVVKSVGF